MAGAMAGALAWASGALDGALTGALASTAVGCSSTAVRGSVGWLWMRISVAPMANTATPKTAIAAQRVLLLPVVWVGETEVFIGVSLKYWGNTNL